MHSKVLEVNILVARVHCAEGDPMSTTRRQNTRAGWEAFPSQLSVFVTSAAVPSLNSRVPGDLWLWLPIYPQINSCLEKRQLMSQGSLHTKNHWTGGKDHCQHREKGSPEMSDSTAEIKGRAQSGMTGYENDL